MYDEEHFGFERFEPERDRALEVLERLRRVRSITDEDIDVLRDALLRRAPKPDGGHGPPAGEEPPR